MRSLALRFLLSLTLLGLMCRYSFAAGEVAADPNTAGAAPADAIACPDSRLAQKVTYEARHETVEQILQDLSEMTGIKLRAGSRKSDWPVCSRKMNVFVKDVPMSDLMGSIARVMKFRWSRSDTVTPPTYRLRVDSKAAAAADAKMARAEKEREEVWRKRRQEWIDAIMDYGLKSPSQLESLRQTNPVVYRYARYGAVQALRALFVEVPEAKSRFAAGQGFRISADKLSTQTADLLYSAGNEYWKYLQMKGHFGKLMKEPTGYGKTFRPDAKFDIAYCRLDVACFTPNLRWGMASIVSTGYFHLMVDGADKEMADLRAINEDWSRYLCEWNNRVLDGQELSPNDDGSARHAKLVENQKKEEESLYPSEPLNEHPDFPELQKTVKLKLDAPKADENSMMATNSYIASFQKALAEAAGISVVSDSWVNIEGDKLPDQESTLGGLLEKFSSQFNYNWDKPSGILEFRHRKWWKNRLNQIPDEWIAAWSENTRKNGILSLDDLSQISTLTYDQAEESLKPDKVLGQSGLYRQILTILDANGNLIWLRLYSSLSTRQRDFLTGQFGLTGQMLTSEQWKLAQPMFDRIGAPRGEAIMRMDLIPGGRSGKDLTCQFVEIDADSGEVDRKWVVKLPRYQPPASKEKGEVHSP